MLVSPVPDWVLSKVWRIPLDEVKLENAKVEAAMEKIRDRSFA